ncbi:MAG: cupin domain-containing protein [Anaerolineales bacterium]|nr:cupin domain-containing protein [Anaerolineales bacterium]
MNPKKSPRYQRDGVVSYLLVSERTCAAKDLSITLVTMEPDGFQKIHKHRPEQTYIILTGSGIMSVAGEERPVEPGDCIFIPSWDEHGLKNTGGTVLKYLSACSPSFTLQQCEKWWPLPSEEES